MGEFIRIIMYIQLVLLFLLCLNIATAAIISGSIYDLSLQKESNAVVEINTVPQQLLVSKSGDYSFNVRPGTYSLYAFTNTSEAAESLVVADDGNYTLDIILAEKLTDMRDILLKESDMNVSSADIQEPKSNAYMIVITIIVVLLLLAIIAFFIVMRSRKHKRAKHGIEHGTANANKNANISVDEHEQRVLSIIKKEKRTTQKDLRKEIPLSEAKVSLIISDLEDKGKIRKIKKGRGNILIFVKD